MENRNNIKNILMFFGSVALGLGLYVMTNVMTKDPVRILNVATWPNDQYTVSRTIYDPDNKKLSYFDNKPFGSLDYVIDWTSGERLLREPNDRDRIRFSELEKEAKGRGLIK